MSRPRRLRTRSAASDAKLGGGRKVLGLVHTHPKRATAEELRLSGPDVETATKLATALNVDFAMVIVGAGDGPDAFSRPSLRAWIVGTNGHAAPAGLII